MSSTIARPAAAVWRQRTERLALLELEYQFHPSFRGAAGRKEFLRDDRDLPDRAAAHASVPPGLPSHLVSLCARPLLSPGEERRRFWRMNYAKYQADVLLRRLDSHRLNRTVVAKIEDLLAVASRERDEIVTANTRLVVSIAKRFANPIRTFDEFLSDGLETLLRAVEKFDFSRGFRFSTYATTALVRAMQRSLRLARRDRDRVLIGEPQHIDVSFHPPPTDEADCALHSQQMRSVVERLIQRLDPREQLIVNSRYGLNEMGTCQPLRSLAEDLGVCKERVRQLEMRARAKLRALYDQLDLNQADIP